ncbi:hypothetical protein FRC11_003956, partial [Ceratobasidium sp. 423]
GGPKHNIEVKNHILPHGLHEGTHHIGYAYQMGKFNNQPLNAIQQGAIFRMYMELIEEMQLHKLHDLWNLCMQIWNYCIPALTLLPPYEWSPDVTQLVESKLSSYLPASALDAAPVHCLQQQQDLAVQDMSSEVMLEPEESELEDDGAEEDEQPWQIVSNASGAFFLVGVDHTGQINSNVVDNIIVIDMDIISKDHLGSMGLDGSDRKDRIR